MEHKLILKKSTDRMFHLLDFEDVANFKEHQLDESVKIMHRNAVAPAGKGEKEKAATAGTSSVAGTQYGQDARDEARRRMRRVRRVGNEIALEIGGSVAYLGREQMAMSAATVGPVVKPSRFFVLEAAGNGEAFNVIPVTRWYKCEKPRQVHRVSSDDIEVRMSAKYLPHTDRLPLVTREEVEAPRSFHSMRVDGPRMDLSVSGKSSIVRDDEEPTWLAADEDNDKKERRKRSAYVTADMKHAAEEGDEDMQEVDIDNVFNGDDNVMDSDDELGGFGGKSRTECMQIWSGNRKPTKQRGLKIRRLQHTE